MTPILAGSQTYESGAWSVSEARAAALVGATICLHDRETAPAYFGGEILGYRLVPEGEANAGKVVFTFERSKAVVGHRTSGEGWGTDYKLVL